MAHGYDRHLCDDYQRQKCKVEQQKTYCIMGTSAIRMLSKSSGPKFIKEKCNLYGKEEIQSLHCSNPLLIYALLRKTEHCSKNEVSPHRMCGRLKLSCIQICDTPLLITK